MIRKGTIVRIGLSSVLCIVIVLAAVKFGFADVGSGDTDWFSQAPTVTKGIDIDAATYAAASDCMPQTLPVAYGLSKTFEDRCYFSTAAGLIEKEGKFIRPPGYDTVYPINTNSGSGVMWPIPGQAGALWLKGDSSGLGVNLGYFRNVYNHMSFNPLTQKFDFDGSPDFYFKYDDGRPMQFGYATLHISGNGRYIIVDTIYNGYVVLDTLNLGFKPVVESFPAGTGGTRATAISDSGKYAAVSLVVEGNAALNTFKLVDTSTCTGGLNADSYVRPVFQCRTVNLAPYVNQAIPNLAGITNIHFANDRTVTFMAQYGTAATGYHYGRYAMTAGGQPVSLVQYEALGDSYISGEGAFSYRAGTDTDRNKCHQSTVSYPYVLSTYFSSFASVACSGARQRNIVQNGDERQDQLIGGLATDEEKIQSMNSRMPGGVFQSYFVQADDPEAITLSIGGNDVGFSGIVQKCINPFQNLQATVVSHSTCYDTYEDRLEVINTINRQFVPLRNLYASLKTRSLGDRRVYVIGYPQVAKVGSNCGLNVAMNADEVAFAHDLIAYLDSVIQRAANEAGVQYVDTQAAFDGHRLCEAPAGQVAVNGITMVRGPGGEVDIKGSYHPNALGHQLLATTIAAQTNQLTKAMPAASPQSNQIVTDPNLPLLQNVPHTNRVVRYVEPLLEAVPKVIQRGVSFNFTLSPSQFFTKANGVYNFVINSEPTNLGNFTAAADGSLSISAAIPASVPPGFHTLHVYGNDIFGNAIDIQEVVFVAATGDDFDGDSVPNDSDSCVVAAQSGVDADRDGVDDVCDPQVAAQPAVEPLPDDIIWHDNSILSGDIQAIRPQAAAGP